MTAKLSVIVPVYNSEKYLAGTLDSLLNQTLHDIDIICVDDGSTDNSPKILKQYAKKDKRIRVLTKKNGGQSSARNAGLKLAKTEFIAFVDSDDMLVPNAYEIAMSKMTNDIDFVHFGIQTVGSSDEQRQQADDNYYEIKFDGKTKITPDLISSVDVSPCNKIFRKSVIDKYDISFPEGLHYEDAYFCNIYALNSKYGFYIKDKLYKYLRHDGSTMTNTFNNKPGYSIDHLAIAIKMYEYMVQHNIFDKYKHYFGRTFFSYFNFAMVFENTNDGKEALYDMAIDFLNKNNLSFACFNDMVIPEQTLRERSYGNNITKHMFGLLCKKVKNQNIRYLFCGIPLMRVKYCADKTRYYPFALLCLYEKKRLKKAEK